MVVVVLVVVVVVPKIRKNPKNFENFAAALGVPWGTLGGPRQNFRNVLDFRSTFWDFVPASPVEKSHVLVLGDNILGPTSAN